MDSVKLLFFAVISPLLLISCSGTDTKIEGDNDGDKAQEVVQAELTEVTIPVDGMTCTSCTQSVETAVKKISGINGCEADFAAGNAVVKYDGSKTNVDEIVAVINSETSFSAKNPAAQM